MPSPLSLTACHHISREVADVQKSIAFYHDVMGFEAIWRPEFAFDGAWMLNYGVQIHLIKGNPPDRTRKISTRADHVAFYTNDIEESEQRLKEHGVEYVKSVQPHTGTIQLFFHDPDGNHIELGTYPDPKPLPG